MTDGSRYPEAATSSDETNAYQFPNRRMAYEQREAYSWGAWYLILTFISITAITTTTTTYHHLLLIKTTKKDWKQSYFYSYSTTFPHRSRLCHATQANCWRFWSPSRVSVLTSTASCVFFYFYCFLTELSKLALPKRPSKLAFELHWGKKSYLKIAWFQLGY